MTSRASHQIKPCLWSTFLWWIIDNWDYGLMLARDTSVSKSTMTQFSDTCRGHKATLKTKDHKFDNFVIRSCIFNAMQWWPKQMANFCRWHFQTHFIQWKSLYFDTNFTIFFPKGLIDNRSAMGQVMACRLLGVKPLCEPMMTTFHVTIWCHKAAIN